MARLARGASRSGWSLRSLAVWVAAPSLPASNQTTAVTIFGVGFSTNQPATVTIGPPVSLPLTNVVVHSRARITAVVPPGGGLGTGAVNVISAPTNGVLSFGRFVNQ
jgi:hypothetical protein